MKKYATILICLLLACMALPLAACSTDDSQITVTFDYNYDGAPAAVTRTVDEEGLVTPPETDPTREHYVFAGWYTDSACTQKADFEYTIDADTTFYAGWTLSEITVTFSLGYDDLVYDTEVISVGGTVGQPTSPTRTGYIFDGWYLEGASEEFDFSTALSSDTTIVAHWEERDSDATYYTVTYMWNYDGAPNDGVFSVQEVRANARATSLQPSRGEEYLLDSGNWYTEPECVNKFNFTTTRITEDITLYARWYDRYTFEAEYTDLASKPGSGYSGGGGGLGNILKDTYEADASNGFFVSYMYYNGAYLEFDVEAAEDITDAVLYLRLSAEITDIYLTSDIFRVEVNGEYYDYSDIDIDITVSGADSGYSDVRKQPFENFYITSSLRLNKGSNVIKLIVDNSIQMGSSGTMYATSPIYDCIYIYSDTEVKWDESKGSPFTDNIANK